MNYDKKVSFVPFCHIAHVYRII